MGSLSWNHPSTAVNLNEDRKTACVNCIVTQASMFRRDYLYGCLVNVNDVAVERDRTGWIEPGRVVR